MDKLCLLLCLLWLCFYSTAYGANSGQIINVNQNYQIAFTDLGSQSLKQGDLVKVFVSDDNFVYMQVVESSAILSKLGVSHQENFKTNVKDLSLVAVGDKVTVFNNVDDASLGSAAPAISVPSNTQQMNALLAQLAQAKDEINHLQQVNQLLKAQINSLSSSAETAKNSMVSNEQLKMRLQKIQQLLNQN